METKLANAIRKVERQRKHPRRQNKPLSYEILIAMCHIEAGDEVLDKLEHQEELANVS